MLILNLHRMSSTRLASAFLKAAVFCSLDNDLQLKPLPKQKLVSDDGRALEKKRTAVCNEHAAHIILHNIHHPNLASDTVSLMANTKAFFIIINDRNVSKYTRVRLPQDGSHQKGLFGLFILTGHLVHSLTEQVLLQVNSGCV